MLDCRGLFFIIIFDINVKRNIFINDCLYVFLVEYIIYIFKISF